MSELLPGIEVTARGLRWELVETQPLGEQTLFRLRGLEGVIQGIEIDILSPLEEIAEFRGRWRAGAARGRAQ